VVSAGYGAEYGRALGGVVNLATKSGTNEWHGSAFSYLAPGAFSGTQSRVVSRSTSLTGVTEPDYTTNIGAEVGGPIIKDKLFIWVGYAPEITRTHLVQYADKFVEHVDPTTGQPDGTQANNPDGTPLTVPLYRAQLRGRNHHSALRGKADLEDCARADGQPGPVRDLFAARVHARGQHGLSGRHDQREDAHH
jgi:hypothetical protein